VQDSQAKKVCLPSAPLASRQQDGNGFNQLSHN
jgi:hypothetical protein